MVKSKKDDNIVEIKEEETQPPEGEIVSNRLER